MAAFNSDFIPDDVYVSLYYRSPGKPAFTKIAKPFITPAAIHKAVMLDNPDYKLENLQTSEAFNNWLKEDNISEREKKTREQWWGKIQALTANQKGGTIFEGLNEDGSIKREELTAKQTTIKIIDGYPIPIDPPKSYAEAFERSEEKAVAKSKEEHPDVFELAATLSDKINALDTAVDKAKSDKAGAGLTMIPFYSVLEIGKIFVEGLRYGKNNWKKGVNDPDWQEERLDHALLHLAKWKEGDRTENHLAKVAWFCVVQLELERLQRDNTPS